MTVSISDVSQASNSEWDSCWAGCDFATYFQSREWMEMWVRLDDNGAQLEPRVISFADGKRAILPLYTRRIHKGLVKIHSLSAGGAYGGWLSNDTLDLNHARCMTEYLLGLGDIDWLTNPCDPLILNSGVISDRIDETHIVALHGDMNMIVRKWTKGHRSAVQKAQRSGVLVRTAESVDDWQRYYDIYLDSLRRWGESATSDYPYEMFESLWALKSDNVTLWLAVYQGIVVAGAVCLYAKKHVSYWHGAALETHFELRPVNLLMRDAMSDACARGFEWFDLGLSGGHEGVRSFKKSFGSVASPSLLVVGTTRWRRMIATAVEIKDQVTGSRSQLRVQ